MTLSELIRLSLEEDLGPGDITTEACVAPEARGTGRILAKQALVVSGVEAAVAAFSALGVETEVLIPDGGRAAPGDLVMRLSGAYADILRSERLALNVLMRLSGIATHTAGVVAAAEGKLRVVCTRKTTPLHRSLEKAAVRHGGGHNHRHGLYDGVLIKDNHILAAGGVRQALQRAKAHAHHLVRIEIEVETLEQLDVVLEEGADVVLLDNMDDETLREAVARRDASASKPLLEASGNMSAARIADIRDIGLDIVSVGGLVHQSRWVDLSLRLDPA